MQALCTGWDYNFVQRCQPWVQKLLLGASSLTALRISEQALPRSPVLQHVPLRHLDLRIQTRYALSLDSLFADVSSCLTLESLTHVGSWSSGCDESIKLPSMQLHGMPSLKHVRLENCIPAHAFSLPADCSSLLDASCGPKLWHEQQEKFRDHTAVLQLRLDRYTEWPPGIWSHPNLQYLKLSTSAGIYGQDLADLQHIPHVKVVLDSGDELLYGGEGLRLTGGSWHSLEIFDFGELHLTISDVESFVRDTGSFTVMSKITRGDIEPLFKEIQGACRRHGRACHVSTHRARMFSEGVEYVTLSTSKEVAVNSPVFCDDCEETLEYQMGEEDPLFCDDFTDAEMENNYMSVGFGSDKTLFDWDAFWPCKPFASVRRYGSSGPGARWDSCPDKA